MVYGRTIIAWASFLPSWHTFFAPWNLMESQVLKVFMVKTMGM